MDRSKEINMLEETLQILKQGWYEKNGKRIKLKLSVSQMQETRICLPDDVKKYSSDPNFGGPFVIGRCGHGCENADSYAVARKLLEQTYLFTKDDPGVLVLNLANPVNPGGGVRRGARAQEETLCRNSSLLLSLESKEARKYYEYNRSLNTYMGSDALMITPHVEIIRDENGVLLDDTVVVSVLTCAAPMITYGKEGMTEEEFEDMVYNRIDGMLKCSAYFGYRHLVLGAWVCGAFGNDAHVISDLFYRALKDLKYNKLREKDLFRRIDFAVLDRTQEQYNFKEFYRNFSFDNFFRDEKQQAIDEAMERIRKTEIHLNQIRGCLIGGAAGDALGYTIEFDSEDKIFAKYGKSGITEYELDKVSGKALISDDTQMTLFTANGLLVGDTRGAMRGIQGWPRGYVASAYQDWLRTQEMSYEESRIQPRGHMHGCTSWLSDVPELYSRRAPGNTCISALQKQKNGEGYIDDYVKSPQNTSKGCGGVMRIAPLALNYHSVDIKQLDMEGAEIAAITHGHSLGYMPAAVLTHIINRIVFSEKRVNLKDVVIEARNTVAELFRKDKHIQELEDIINLAVQLAENCESDLDNIHKLGEGWVAEEALAIALYCSLRHQDDFSAGIIAAVNHKGDSDSTGAITGNILGALLGTYEIDDKWKENLELYDVILEMADDLCHGCQMSEYSDYEDQDWFRKYIRMQWKDEKLNTAKPTELLAVDGSKYQIIDGILNVQAIVRIADEHLEYGEFPANQIIQAGGPKLLHAVIDLRGCKIGEAKITKFYGHEQFQHVIHSVDPRTSDNKKDWLKLLSSCYRACLNLAVEKGIKSIAFPSIGTGYKDCDEKDVIPLNDAVKEAVRTVKEFSVQCPGKIDVIKWVCYDEATLKAYSNEIEHWKISEMVQSPDYYSMNKMLRNGGS